MELETIQGTRLRTLMETWRDNINDCNIVCTPDGIMSTAMDPGHISLAHFKIFASGVERYTCTGTHLLGINTTYFHKYIKNIAHHHDLLKLRYDPARPDVLSIQISSEGSGPREAEMNLLALDEPEDNHIPEQGYSTVLSMVSAELTKIIREMANNADKVWISCRQTGAGPRVTFTSDGEAGRLTYTVNHGQDEAELELEGEIHMQVSALPQLPGTAPLRLSRARPPASTPSARAPRTWPSDENGRPRLPWPPGPPSGRGTSSETGRTLSASAPAVTGTPAAVPRGRRRWSRTPTSRTKGPQTRGGTSNRTPGS